MLRKLGAASMAGSAEIVESGQFLTFAGANYVWRWSAKTDYFSIFDQQGVMVTEGPIQPAVVVKAVGNSIARATCGTLQGHVVRGNRVIWTYSNVNGSARLSTTWRFDEHGVWVEPIVYHSWTVDEIVSVRYFAKGSAESVRVLLESNYLVLPGVCESEGISPIVNAYLNLDIRTSLGRAGTALTQQWGLPVHYFAGFRNLSMTPSENLEEDKNRTRAFCCGLTEVPSSDVFIEQKAGRSSLVFDYRGDLWGHLRGPGEFKLGAGLLWAFGPNYHEAIRKYYTGLLEGEVIHMKVNSARKNAALLAPQWCTWGEQMALHKEGSDLDQASLEKFYDDLTASGLDAGMVSIDDGWEGKYGRLEHSAERLPRFEQFLDRVRADGHYIGLWAAFMRCQDPSDLGLSPHHMLRQVDGQPYVVGEGANKYYILDFTRPEVEKVLGDRARQFVRRYKPDLVKFDFGYEIPSLATVAPYDMHWAGERMMQKGLDVIVKSMRQENPDIVVMYYQLSPLFADYFDLHSGDDMFMAKGEYELEANRRFFFSGLCGEFGMPTYGSSGYDWGSESEMWFDSSVIGTIGSLASLSGRDEVGGRLTSRIAAKYNGLKQALRHTNQFSIVPLDPVFDAVTRGAHASSWVRLESGKPMLLALRTLRLDGGRGITEYKGILSTTCSVVVSSRSEDALGQTARLAVVPYGDGALTLQVKAHGSSVAEIKEHLYKDKPIERLIQIREGVLEIPLHETAENGSPVEWIEIQITPAEF
jgi:hypothetical protein